MCKKNQFKALIRLVKKEKKKKSLIQARFHFFHVFFFFIFNTEQKNSTSYFDFTFMLPATCNNKVHTVYSTTTVQRKIWRVHNYIQKLQTEGHT